MVKWLKKVIEVINISRREMNGSNFEPSQNQMHMLARVIVPFDDFLRHLTIPPVLKTFETKISPPTLFSLMLISSYNNFIEISDLQF